MVALDHDEIGAGRLIGLGAVLFPVAEFSQGYLLLALCLAG
jgi:hypothetical protein